MQEQVVAAQATNAAVHHRARHFSMLAAGVGLDWVASRNTRGWRIRCFSRIGHRLSPVMAALGVVREFRRHIAVLERVIAERQER